MFGPVTHPSALSTDRIPRRCTVWAKRDDVNSPLAFGVQDPKLEYLVADAWRAAVTRSCRSVACNRITLDRWPRRPKTGMKCVPSKRLGRLARRDYDRVGNILLSLADGRRRPSRAAGFGIDQGELGRRFSTLKMVAASLRHSAGVGPSPRRPGLRRVGEEVEQQRRNSGSYRLLRRLFGDGGTKRHDAGFAQSNDPRTVIGIGRIGQTEETWAQIARIARRHRELIGVERDIATRIILDDRFHAGYYGIPDQRHSRQCGLGPQWRR